MYAMWSPFLSTIRDRSGSGFWASSCGSFSHVSEVFSVPKPSRPANGITRPAASAPDSTLTPRNSTIDWTMPRSPLSLTRMAKRVRDREGTAYLRLLLRQQGSDLTETVEIVYVVGQCGHFRDRGTPVPATEPVG